jgi:integrase
MAVYLRNAIWWIGYSDPQGRWIRESTQCRNKKEAQGVLASIKTKIVEGKFFNKTQKQKLPFKVVAERVLEYQRAMKRRSVEQFHRHYTNHLITYFGKKFLDEIGTQEVERYRLERSEGVSPATVNRSLAVLKRIFNLAIKWDLIDRNPVRFVEFLKEPEGRLRFLSKVEQAALLGQCKGDIYDIILVALRTGMRRGEVLGLRKSDLDFERELIFVSKSKTDKTRQLSMIPEVKVLLQRRAFGLTEETHIFRNKQGQPLRSCDDSFASALSRAGIKDFHFHDLRHSYATDLISAGVDIFTVSKFLGHTDPKITARVYAHLSPEYRRSEMEKYQAYLNDTNLSQPRTFVTRSEDGK